MTNEEKIAGALIVVILVLFLAAVLSVQ